ncbi:MAG: hypothetical protein AB7I42_26015 [Bradyrhizobium sp.]|uniref:hypothetical protein n=1 Tax=Bradyrhizobium sp. TaxID=376 RepID=UPI003D128E74
MLWADLALAACAGLCDRIRGGFPDDRLFPEGKPVYVDPLREVAKFYYGAALAAIVSSDWRVIVACAVLWKFGEQVASDFGGTFRLIAGVPYWVSPLIRVGLLWPAMTMPLCLLDPRILMLVPASLFGTFVSAVIARWAPLPRTDILQMQTAAGWQELLRGLLIGLALVVMETFA